MAGHLCQRPEVIQPVTIISAREEDDDDDSGDDDDNGEPANESWSFDG
jgi:hypothetical protein